MQGGKAGLEAGGDEGLGGEGGVPKLAAVVPLHLHPVLRRPVAGQRERAGQRGAGEEGGERRGGGRGAGAHLGHPEVILEPRDVLLEGGAAGVLEPAAERVDHLVDGPDVDVPRVLLAMRKKTYSKNDPPPSFMKHWATSVVLTGRVGTWRALREGTSSS